MNHPCQLSNVTKDYLRTFYSILDEMIQKMTEAQLTDSISYNFIVQMIPHHRAAIEMSENILKYTTSLSIQNIASQIITEQTKSIADMEQIMYCCGQLNNSRQDVCLYQRRVNQIMRAMFYGMEHACSDNMINADFLREMLPHHRGAVELSQTTLQYEICEELIPVLNAIITSQCRGILQMQQLLQCIRN